MRNPVSGGRGETRLASLLRTRGIQRVVIVGIATDYCVEETAMDATHLRFEVAVLREGIRAVDLRPETASEPSRR